MRLRLLLLSGLFGVCGLAVQVARAQDNCFDYCLNTCDSSDSSCTGNCSLRCSPGGDLDETWNKSSSPYGAIAYGEESQAYGYAFNQASPAKANKVALSNCAKHGGDCKIVIQLTHACGAVAAGSSNVWAAEQGASQDEAQRNALASCAVNAAGLAKSRPGPARPDCDFACRREAEPVTQADDKPADDFLPGLAARRPAARPVAYRLSRR
jgi:Domain of unknown function (DUF4189)